jgi:hypothetical protein
MSPHAYTEDQLVEQPAIGLFSSLGWQTVSAIDETYGPSPPTPLPKGEAIPDLERDGSRSKYALGIHERESSFVFGEYRQHRRDAGPRTKTKNTVRINQGEDVRSWQA